MPLLPVGGLTDPLLSTCTWGECGQCGEDGRGRQTLVGNCNHLKTDEKSRQCQCEETCTYNLKPLDDVAQLHVYIYYVRGLTDKGGICYRQCSKMISKGCEKHCKLPSGVRSVGSQVDNTAK